MNKESESQILPHGTRVRQVESSSKDNAPRFLVPNEPNFPIRPRLVKELNSLRRDLWLIAAGPGYGKTSLLAYWSHQQETPIAWCSLTEEEARIECFTHSLKIAISKIAANFDIKLGDSETSQHIADILTSSLSSVGPLTIVLDNIQCLHQKGRSSQVLERAIDFLPPNIHLVLIGTGRPTEYAWLRSKLHGGLQWLGVESLSFRPSEIAKILELPGRTDRRSQTADWSDNQAFQLLTETGGWPLAVDCLTRQHQSKGLLRSSLDEYFDVIWENLNELDKELLRRCAPFEVVGEELANLVMESELIEEHFRGLTQFGIFLTPLRENRRRISRLARAFLLKKLRKNHKQFVDSHARAAGVMAHLGKSMEAAKNLIEIDENELAKKLLTESPLTDSAYRLPGDQAEFLSRLESPSEKETPDIISLARAVALGQAGDIKGSLALLREIQQRAESTEDLNIQVDSLTEQAQLLIDTSQPKPAIQAVEKALTLVQDDSQKERLTLMLTENSFLRGKIRGLKENSKTPGELTMDARYLVRTGQLQSLKLRVENLISGVEMSEVRPRRSFLDPDLAGSFVASCQGDSKVAEFHAKRSIERGQRFQCLVTQAIGLARLGHALALQENSDEATARYQQSADICDKMGVARVKAEPLMGLAFLAAADGDYSAAIRYAKLSGDCLLGTGDIWAQGQISLAEGAALLGIDKAQAEHKILESIEFFKQCEDPHMESAALLWLSCATQSNREQLESSVQMKGYGFLLDNPTLYGPRTIKEQAKVAKELRVSSFGKIRVWRKGEEILKPFARRKAKELFAILLQHRSQLLRKEFLLDLLWPDSSPKKADGDFRVALHGVAGVLDPNRTKKQGVRWLQKTPEGYSLNPDNEFSFDCDIFEQAIVSAQNTQDPNTKDALLRKAVDLYSGDYLQEFSYEEWCIGERVRYQGLFLEAAEELALSSLAKSQHQNALQLANSILTVDPAWEEAYRIGIKVHLEKGRTAQALRAYEKCVRNLQEELGLSPSEETSALIQNALKT